MIMIEEQTVLEEIRNTIKALPPELEESVNELALHVQLQISRAGEPVGSLALALVVASVAVGS